MSGTSIPRLQLSVLDQSPVPEGTPAGQALRNSIDLAQLADRAGYERVWVAEHHATPGLACNSPEVLIGPIAQATSRIRVGSGGIMLPHYSPLKVAESFLMLEGMFPGRIDLGVGRAAGTSQKVARALQRDRRQVPPDDFREQLEELMHYVSPEGSELSLLGSSPQSAHWAAELGLPYVFADFINPEGAEHARIYRERFQPSAFLQKPRVSVCVWAVCAETDQEAVRLSFSARMMLALLFRGKLIQVPSVERAEEFARNQGVPPEMLAPGRRFLMGSPANIRKGIEAVAREYTAEEVLLVNIVHSHEARRRSYELVAEEFALSPCAANAA